MDPNTQVTSQPVQPFSPQPITPSVNPTTPPVVPPSTFSTPPNRGSNPLKTILLAFLIIIFLGVIAGGSYYLGTQKALSMLPIPQMGQRTAQKIVNPVVTKIPTVVTPTPNIASSAAAATANWQASTNVKYGYSVKYPANLVTNENNTYYHYVEFNPTTQHILPTFLIAVIADTFVAKDIAAYNYMSSDWINSFYTLPVGESKIDGATTFTKLSDTTVNGQPELTVGVATATYKEQRVYVKANGNIYMVSVNYEAVEELPNFALFLSTFQLTK